MGPAPQRAVLPGARRAWEVTWTAGHGGPHGMTWREGRGRVPRPSASGLRLRGFRDFVPLGNFEQLARVRETPSGGPGLSPAGSLRGGGGVTLRFDFRISK